MASIAEPETRRSGVGYGSITKDRLWNKPGALRNGAPFQDWALPPALARLRRKLGSGDEADRRFVRVLAAISTDGLEAVEGAIGEAFDTGAASDEVILNILARRREPPADQPLSVVVDLKLKHPPRADCAIYGKRRGDDIWRRIGIR